jgi:hypothetical protein
MALPAAHGDREAAIHFALGQGWGKDDWLMVHSVHAADEKLPCLVYVMGIGEMIGGATRSGGRPIYDAAEHHSDPFNPEFVRWSDPDKNRLQTG